MQDFYGFVITSMRSHSSCRSVKVPNVEAHLKGGVDPGNSQEETNSLVCALQSFQYVATGVPVYVCVCLCVIFNKVPFPRESERKIAGRGCRDGETDRERERGKKLKSVCRSETAPTPVETNRFCMLPVCVYFSAKQLYTQPRQPEHG